MHADWPDNVALSVGGAVGEIDLTRPGLTVVRERFRHQRLAAMPIECRGVLADYDAEAGVLTVWASIQSPYSQRDVIARVLGLAAERVPVIVPDVGAAFAPNPQAYAHHAPAAVAACPLGRPVNCL